MWLLAAATFWASLGILLYTYVGYPLLIIGMSRIRPRRVRKGDSEPTVSVILAARNEQERIGGKLDNLLSLDYPADKLQIVVVSDGSTDDTNQIVERYASRNVHLERLGGGEGKAVALNTGVARATGDVLLFCDVRQRIDAHALRRLAEWFADPDIGAVSGELHLEGDEGPGAYWKYEKAIRAAESRVDSVVGATGALYAVRRTLFTEIPRGCLLDDVFTPMRVVLKGYRVGFEPQAKAFDQEASIQGEFARKARTLAGNFQLLHLEPNLLNPRRNRIFFQLISHKVVRLVCPFALLFLLVTSVLLLLGSSPLRPFYAVMLFGQLLAYGLAVWAMVRTGKVGRLARLCHTFVVLNAAAVEGLRRYLKGELQWTTGR